MILTDARMNFLIDTNVFLWLINGEPKLPASLLGAFADPDNEPLLSSVSAAEIAINYSIGKIQLPEELLPFIEKQRRDARIGELPLVSSAALLLGNLPFHHRDPFDRMLICQAMDDGTNRWSNPLI